MVDALQWVVGTVPSEPVWRLRVAHLFALAWLMLLLVYLPRRWEPWAAGLVALVLRLGLQPAHLLMGGAYPELRGNAATGLLDVGQYGPTWSAMLGPAWLLTGEPMVPLLVNPWISALTVVVVWKLVHDAVDGRTAALASGLLAVLPLPIALARTETMFVLVALLQVAAVAGVLSEERSGRIFGVLSGFLLLQLRPGQAVFCFALLVLLAWRKDWMALAFLGVPVGVFAADLLSRMAQSGVGSVPGELTSLGRLLVPHHWVGFHGRFATLDPWITPFGVAVVAAGALVVHRSRPQVQVPIWSLCFLAAAAPYLHLFRHTDVTRFHMPSQSWLVILAAVALASMTSRIARVAAAGVGLTFIPARSPLGPQPFTWQAEYEVFQPAIEALESTAVVRHQTLERYEGQRAMYLDRLRPTFVSLLDRPMEVGEYLWIGRFGPTREETGCELHAVIEETIAVRHAEIEYLEGDTRVVGLYRCLQIP